MYEQFHDPMEWRFLYSGIAAGNPLGGDISADRATRYATAFSEPLEYNNVRTAGLYDEAGFCAECRLPYCSSHWSVDRGGYGTCPRGHGKSLDPHWSPENYD